jgi:hypothetical protein
MNRHNQKKGKFPICASLAKPKGGNGEPPTVPRQGALTAKNQRVPENIEKNEGL